MNSRTFFGQSLESVEFANAKKIANRQRKQAAIVKSLDEPLDGIQKALKRFSSRDFSGGSPIALLDEAILHAEIFKKEKETVADDFLKRVNTADRNQLAAALMQVIDNDPELAKGQQSTKKSIILYVVGIAILAGFLNAKNNLEKPTAASLDLANAFISDLKKTTPDMENLLRALSGLIKLSEQIQTDLPQISSASYSMNDAIFGFNPDFLADSINQFIKDAQNPLVLVNPDKPHPKWYCVGGELWLIGESMTISDPAMLTIQNVSEADVESCKTGLESLEIGSIASSPDNPKLTEVVVYVKSPDFIPNRFFAKGNWKMTECETGSGDVVVLEEDLPVTMETVFSWLGLENPPRIVFLAPVIGELSMNTTAFVAGTVVLQTPKMAITYDVKASSQTLLGLSNLGWGTMLVQPMGGAQSTVMVNLPTSNQVASVVGKNNGVLVPPSQLQIISKIDSLETTDFEKISENDFKISLQYLFLQPFDGLSVQVSTEMMTETLEFVATNPILPPQ